jgi:hypothetical protein
MKTLDWSMETLGLDYNSTGLCKGPVIKYLLGRMEDIFGGYEKKREPLRGVRKKQQNL